MDSCLVCVLAREAKESLVCGEKNRLFVFRQHEKEYLLDGKGREPSTCDRKRGGGHHPLAAPLEGLELVVGHVLREDLLSAPGHVVRGKDLHLIRACHLANFSFI